MLRNATQMVLDKKMWLWIFRPKMTLHDIPKMSQIGVKSHTPKTALVEDS